MGRLAREGVVEEMPGSGGSPSHPPAYRLVAARRRSRNNGVQPKVGRPGGSQPIPTSNHQVRGCARQGRPPAPLPWLHQGTRGARCSAGWVVAFSGGPVYGLPGPHDPCAPPVHPCHCRRCSHRLGTCLLAWFPLGMPPSVSKCFTTRQG
jgi:hypothetical protein